MVTISIQVPQEFADMIGQAVARHMKQEAQTENDNATYSREEYAELIGKTPATVSRLYKKGEIMGITIGRSIRIYKNQMRKAS